jgi:hypothetical protein
MESIGEILPRVMEEIKKIENASKETLQVIEQ